MCTNTVREMLQRRTPHSFEHTGIYVDAVIHHCTVSAVGQRNLPSIEGDDSLQEVKSKNKDISYYMTYLMMSTGRPAGVPRDGRLTNTSPSSRIPSSSTTPYTRQDSYEN